MDKQKAINDEIDAQGQLIAKTKAIEQEKYDRMVYVWNLNNIEKAI